MAKPSVPFNQLTPDLQKRLIDSGVVPAQKPKVEAPKPIVQKRVAAPPARASVSRAININQVRLSELPSDVRDWLAWVIRFDDLRGDVRHKVIAAINFNELPPDLVDELEMSLKIRKGRKILKRYDLRIGHLPWPMVVKILSTLRVADLPAELWRRVVKTLGIKVSRGKA